MRENHMLAQLRQGKPSIGLWVQSQSVNIARIIAAQGWFDWLLVDMEHSPVDLSTTALMLGAIADISGGHCTPLARVPHRTMYHIKQALDAGAQGIIVPMVSTAEEAAEVVRFARYPPDGERGAGGVLARYSFGTTSQPEYIANANREIMVGVQIETREGVENIEAILAVPGLDLIFIGPNDLHLSLGLVPSLWSEQPAFLAAVDQVAQACKSNGKPLGTLARNAESVNARLASGFTMMGMSSDLENLLMGLDSQRKQIK